MIVLDKTTTGDGLICALQILAIMKKNQSKLSDLVSGMSKYPQTNINVKVNRNFNLEASKKVQEAISHAEAELLKAQLSDLDIKYQDLLTISGYTRNNVEELFNSLFNEKN